MKKLIISLTALTIAMISVFFLKSNKISFQDQQIGQKIDSLNGIYVYYNGGIDNVSERNMHNGYNLGLKYQCVEFVKRYYYWHFDHKMPNSYGHAKDFFKKGLKDGTINHDRNLMQYTNGSRVKPRANDLIVIDGNAFNPYGHVAIVSKVDAGSIELVQQNVGSTSRTTMSLNVQNNLWYIDDTSVLGWLRKLQ